MILSIKNLNVKLFEQAFLPGIYATGMLKAKDSVVIFKFFVVVVKDEKGLKCQAKKVWLKSVL